MEDLDRWYQIEKREFKKERSMAFEKEGERLGEKAERERDI